MRLIAFLLLAAFAMAGIVRYSKAAAPAPPLASAPGEAPRPLISAGLAQIPVAQTSLAEPQPAPQVLRHKRRFARAALRALKKAEAQEQAKPLKQVAKVLKQPRR